VRLRCRPLRLAPALLAIAATACGGRPPSTSTTAAAERERAGILLVTLDTTRADAVAPESTEVETPALAALAARGRRFAQAYTTAPMTLPAHLSMLTGLYPAEHGVHENARYLAAGQPLLAERLHELGYTTAAFVSGFPLDRQFGLGRGFDHYDDDLGGGLERAADRTTARALAWVDAAPAGPLFLWVHFYDAHEPYTPPEPFRSRYPGSPYLGEIAFVDVQLGRLVEAFERRTAGAARLLVTADHGESLGEHGERFHGNLIYQGAMRVPLVAVGPGIAPGVEAAPVSTRRVFDTILAWAGEEAPRSLLAGGLGPVLGEAMKPYLEYGWQPQVMGVVGRLKLIRSGTLEVYDVVADPRESHDLAGERPVERDLQRAVRDYPLPAAEGADTPLSDANRRRLASLGYVASGSRPSLRPDAPNPKDMAEVLDRLDVGSGLFVQGEYARAVPVLESVLRDDPGNFMAALRLAVAHSVLGHRRQALALFATARSLDPASLDLQHYLALHHVRYEEWGQARRLLETVLAAEPERLPAIEALSRVEEAEGHPDEAARLLVRVVAARGNPPRESLLRLGRLHMASGRTEEAIASFERARGLAPEAFPAGLELGVLYLAARRYEDARAALDRIPPTHSDYPMVLFKRAQVSVLLGEPDRAERVRDARAHADAVTRPLLERERLFAGLGGAD
jgi:choline-sulfatase